MGRTKQKERERKRSAASCQRLDLLFNSKRSKTVEIESDTNQCLASEMPHSSDQSDGHKSTGIASYIGSYKAVLA